jgi:hypothetical protein
MRVGSRIDVGNAPLEVFTGIIRDKSDASAG